MARSLGLTPVNQGFIAIGWSEMGDPVRLPPDQEDLKSSLDQALPYAKPPTNPIAAGILFRFAQQMRNGDIVVYPCQADRNIYIGTVTGRPYCHQRAGLRDMPNRRAVAWSVGIHRDRFSPSALYEIDADITLFQITTHADEFRAALACDALPHGARGDNARRGADADNVADPAQDFIIQSLKTKMSPYEFEAFTAHLLTCMGYHTRVTRAASDGGIDIIAHRDELGFEPPVIKVQCKQILEQIGRPDVQKLHGAVENGEYGLFVTLGRFSKDAQVFERSRPNLRLIDGSALVKLIYAYYDAFDPPYKRILPLKRALIPIPAATTPG